MDLCRPDWRCIASFLLGKCGRETSLGGICPLCKFKGRLSPAEMAQDIVFVEAEDSEPFRQRVIVW
jgi:hypothetical protein